MKTRAFTLLEVIVALSILGIALVAVLDINSQAVVSHVYAKKLTVATLLARAKMIDLEQRLHDEGVNADDDEDAGDFSDEGWPSYKWRARLIVPKTNGLTPEQLMGALFNMPMGAGEGGPEGLLGALFGAGSSSGDKGGPTPPAPPFAGPPPGTSGAGGLMSALGPMAGLAQQQFAQMIDQLQRSVREVHLTVSWKEGNLTESIDLVTHVVSLGPGSDRNGGGAAPGGAPQAQAWVRPDGTPARSPRPSPAGVGMVDDDGTVLMTAQQRGLTPSPAGAGQMPRIQGLGNFPMPPQGGLR